MSAPVSNHTFYQLKIVDGGSSYPNQGGLRIFKAGDEAMDNSLKIVCGQDGIQLGDLSWLKHDFTSEPIWSIFNEESKITKLNTIRLCSRWRWSVQLLNTLWT